MSDDRSPYSAMGVLRVDVLFPELFGATPTQPPLIASPPSPAKAKAQGQKKALRPEKEWAAAATAWVEKLPIGQLFTADDLTFAVPVPPHHNAVGAIITHCCRADMIQATGSYATSQRPLRRTGMLRVWRRCAR